jgi:hypothetical protein
MPAPDQVPVEKLPSIVPRDRGIEQVMDSDLDFVDQRVATVG